MFAAYQWPGNLRELEHLIEGAMNMAGQEEIIGLEHFTPGIDCLEQVDFTYQDIPFSMAGNMVSPLMEGAGKKSDPTLSQDLRHV